MEKGASGGVKQIRFSAIVTDFFSESIFVDINVMLPLSVCGVVDESHCFTSETASSGGNDIGAKVTVLLSFTFRFL